MKLFLYQISRCFGSQNESGQYDDGPIHHLITMEMPIRAAYTLKKNVSRLSDEFDQIISMHKGIVLKYGTPDENGKVKIDPQSEGWEPFQKEYADLMFTEVDIDITKIDPEAITGNISAKDLIAVEFMFEFPEEPDVPRQDDPH